MTKKLQKTLTGAVATVMATGMVATPAMATSTTDVTALHKAAFQAMQKAEQDKTQKSINEAREAIRAFRAVAPNHADVTTWFSRVDKVQSPIFTKIVKGIEALNKKVANNEVVTQAEVNELRTLCENDQNDDTDNVPSNYYTDAKWGWSEQIDKAQQTIISRAQAAVTKAETSKVKADVDAAKELIAELNTAVRAGVRKIAAALEAKVEAIKVGALNVTKVTSITTTEIKVEFDALKDALRDVTLEVVDNKGNKVQVKTKKVIVEGEVSARFELVNKLSSRATGVWTINGVEYNAGAVNLIADVKEKADDFEALFSILDESDLVDGVVDKRANQEEYSNLAKDRKAKNKINSVADVQAIIDDANKNVVAGAQVEKVVYTAEEGTLSEFRTEFAKLDLARVNSEWDVTYRNRIAGSNATKLSEVQTIIDTVNNEKVEVAEGDLVKDDKLNAAKIEKAIDLVNEYVLTPDDAAKEAKKARIKALNIKMAVVKVNDSETQVSLKAALTNLETVAGKDAFEYAKEVNEDLMQKFVLSRAENGENKTFFSSVDEVKSYLNKVEAKAIEDQVAEVKGKASKKMDNNDNKTALLNALKQLAVVTAKDSVKFDNSKVKSNLVVQYAEAINVESVKTVADIAAAVEKANGIVVTEIVLGANDAKELLAKLKDTRLGLANIVDANADAYYAEYDTMKDSEMTATKLSTIVSNINSRVKIFATTSLSTVKAELTEIAVDNNVVNFINLRDAQKSDAAELVISAIKAKEVKETVDGLVSAIEKACIDRAELMSKINGDSATILSVKEALEVISSEFNELGNGAKLALAEKVLVNRPVTDKNVLVDLNNFTEVRGLINKVK